MPTEQVATVRRKKPVLAITPFNKTATHPSWHAKHPKNHTHLARQIKNA